ncbi:MAG: flagellar motor switch protein FliM [bacterium]
MPDEDDVLGQDEIDALLGELDEGEEESGGGVEEVATSESTDKSSGTPSAEPDDKFKDRNIKTYNFKRPDKFSKDQIRTLQMIHESFARTTTTELSAQLRSLASLTVASVDQLSYEEFMKVVPNPTTLGVLDMEPLDGKAIFEMDPALVFQIVDRLFGGTGSTSPTNLERELTDIEHSVIERIFMSILNNLREAWEEIIELRPRLEQIESNPQFVQIVPPNDMVVLITFDTQIGDVEGMTNLCIPYVILGPVINKLSATFWYSSASHELTDDQIERLREKIDYVEVPVSVEVGKTKLEAGEILDLEEGDIVKLDTGLDDPFKLIINGREKFLCKPGQRGQTRAVQVIEPLEEEEFIANIINDLKDEILEDELEGEAISSGR